MPQPPAAPKPVQTALEQFPERAPAAEAPAEGVQPAPARPAAKKENTAPAHAAAEPAKGAPARSGGRHALPEGSKSSRPKASGTYQGKH